MQWQCHNHATARRNLPGVASELASGPTKRELSRLGPQYAVYRGLAAAHRFFHCDPARYRAHPRAGLYRRSDDPTSEWCVILPELAQIGERWASAQRWSGRKAHSYLFSTTSSWQSARERCSEILQHPDIVMPGFSVEGRVLAVGTTAKGWAISSTMTSA